MNTSHHLESFITKMNTQGLPPLVIDTFAYYYKKVVTGSTGLLYDKELMPVRPDEIADMENIRDHKQNADPNVLKKTIRITLNGGLGTSMGLLGPKSLLKVCADKSFLEIILKQAENNGVKLALMNSFSTDRDTDAALGKINPREKPLTFLQHKFPKILQKDFSPAVCPENPELEWNPPGHGDIYTALFTSGMLQNLLDEGIIYAFISNSDNLGADMDESLLSYFAEKQFPFMMEVAERTPSDMKGGHLARHQNGRLILREAAQCPEAEKDAFRDIRRYRFFNTNNLWINLKFLKQLIEKQKMIQLPMILNPKTLDPRDETTPPVFQVETAMGAAVSLFDGAAAVRVPRTRFFPVKKCNELLALRSDYFLFSDDKPVLNPDRKTDSLKINLDPKYYGKIDQFDERFKNGVPSLVRCESLTIEGDVRFEGNVEIRGNIRIQNTGKTQAVIKG